MTDEKKVKRQYRIKKLRWGAKQRQTASGLLKVGMTVGDYELGLKAYRDSPTKTAPPMIAEYEEITPAAASPPEETKAPKTPKTPRGDK